MFTKTLNLNSNILIKGASSEATIFQFDSVGEAHLIQIKGQITADKIPITQTIHKGNNYLLIEEFDYFQEGDLVKILANDSSLVTSSWALSIVGQIIDIQQVNSDIITFNQQFRKDYALAENPVLTLIQPIKNVDIECLKIVRNDATISQKSNIYFENTTNCWVKGIESEKSNFAHLDIRTSSKIVVEGSYFHDAFDYGGGGKAYGVVLQSTASDCLIQNNVFENLRHAMLLQSGANGNVLAYNFSTQPFWTGTIFPSNAAGDLVLHGNYPYANLFEGNVVQNIVVDASHGKNGPLNTFFRNRTELYGIFTDFITPTDSLNVIGNTILSGEVSPLYSLNGEGHFTYGNHFNNDVLPENIENLNEQSLFLTENPTFFPTNFPFNLLDNLPEPTDFSIPAKDRFDNGFVTLCGEPTPYVISNTQTIIATNLAVNYYRNPLIGNELTIQIDKNESVENITVFIFNSLGQKVLEVDLISNQQTINLANLNQGIYFLKGMRKREMTFGKRVVKLRD